MIRARDERIEAIKSDLISLCLVATERERIELEFSYLRATRDEIESERDELIARGDNLKSCVCKSCKRARSILIYLDCIYLRMIALSSQRDKIDQERERIARGIK